MLDRNGNVLESDWSDNKFRLKKKKISYESILYLLKCLGQDHVNNDEMRLGLN